MAEVSTSPWAWLVPFWAELKQQPFFARLAPELQSEALAVALDADYPAKAQERREWNFATRRAMLAGLDMLLIGGPTKHETELWRMRKGKREVRCVAVHLPVGVDLRLLEGTDMLRTQLVKNPYAVPTVSDQWRAMLQQTSWSIEESQ